MPKITQQQLAKYYDLMREEKLIKERRLKIRQDLLQRLSKKCGVEKGKFSVNYRHGHTKSLSKCVIIESLGEEFYQQLCDSVQPVERTYLCVTDSMKDEK